MTDPKIQISGYKPNPNSCCEACVFGKGKHAEFCGHWLVKALRQSVLETVDRGTAELVRQYDAQFQWHQKPAELNEGDIVSFAEGLPICGVFELRGGRLMPLPIARGD